MKRGEPEEKRRKKKKKKKLRKKKTEKEKKIMAMGRGKILLKCPKITALCGILPVCGVLYSFEIPGLRKKLCRNQTPEAGFLKIDLKLGST